MSNNPRTIEYEGQKAKKVIAKALKDVRKSHPGIGLSETEPTKTLFVVHSCFCCAANWPEILDFFRQIDQQCSFYVFNQQTSYREYVFVTLKDVDSAKRMFDVVNGTKPSWLRPGTMQFHCLYADNFNLKREEVKLPGFNIFPNAISDEKAIELSNFVKSCAASETLKNRTVIHFGHTFDYGTNTASVPTLQIPPVLTDLIAELKTSGLPIDDVEFDQVTVNVYEPGQGIPSHTDTHSAFENQIVVVSLQSDVVIRYKDCANNATTIDRLIPENSVLLMQDAARYKYKHGICTRRYDISPIDNELVERRQRISITYRRVRHEPCACEFEEFCDWDRNGKLALPKTNHDAAILESKYVSEVYENIADHFDTTRFSLWPAFKKFLNGLPKWSLVLDAGCGNGKYLFSDFDLTRIGFDYCENLVKIASRKTCSVFRADLLTIPLRDNSFDAVLCAAVIHHFATPERRLRAFKEIVRVLKPEGRALVSGWSKDQGDSFYEKMRSNRADDEDQTEVPETADRLLVHDGTVFKQEDMLVPWDSQKKEDGAQFLRYYHLFVEGEMESLVNQLENCKLIRTFHEQGNWFVEFEKC